MSNLRRMFPAASLALILTALVLAAIDAAPEARAQNAPDWKPVTIVYNADVVGKIEPCG